MHRDVKPHNVMIDHEKRKVGYWNMSPEINHLRAIVTINRLGPGRILPSRHRIQRPSRIKVLQGARITSRLPGIRLFTRYVVARCNVRLDDLPKRTFLPRQQQFRSARQDRQSPWY